MPLERELAARQIIVTILSSHFSGRWIRPFGKSQPIKNMTARCLCLIIIPIIKSITVTRLWLDADHMKARRVAVIKGPEGHSCLAVVSLASGCGK